VKNYCSLRCSTSISGSWNLCSVFLA